MALPQGPRIDATTDGALSAAVVENSFFNSLEKFQQKVPQEIMDAFIIAKPSEGAQELYAQYGSIPTWRRWDEGESRRVSAMKEYFYTIVNKNWEVTIQYHKNIKADDRTGTFNSKIDSMAKRWAFLDVDIFTQLLESQTNDDLLDNIPNTYYGIGLFSAVHTFVTGGNTMTGSGYSLESQLRSDLYNVQERFRSMNDEEGKRYWEGGDVGFENFVVIAPNSMSDIWDEVINAQIVPGGFGSSSTKTNVLFNKGIKVHIETRLTDTDDWYVILMADPSIKPFVLQPRQEPIFQQKNMANSDHSFETGLELIGGDARKGYSYYEPRSICRVTN